MVTRCVCEHVQNDFRHQPKGDFLLANRNCLSGALGGSNQQDAELEEAGPRRERRSPKCGAPSPVSMTCSWHGPRSHAAQREQQPWLLSCLSFNWSDKPTRPRYFRDGTALLSRQALGRQGPCALPTAACQCTCSPRWSRTGPCLGRHCQSPRSVPNAGALWCGQMSTKDQSEAKPIPIVT